MATIQTSITLADNISNIFNNIISAANLTVSAFQDVQNTASHDIDVNSFDGIREHINAATIATQQFQNELDNVKPKTVEITPVWNIESNLEIFQNTGVDRLTLEMGSLNDMTNEVLKSQQRIGEQALNMDLLPPNASWDINATNQRVVELGEKIAALQNIDISMMDDRSISVMNSEMESLRSSVNEIVNLQENMNTAIEQGDLSSLNSGYSQLNNIAESVEQRVRANMNAIQEMNNIEWHTPQNIEIFDSDGITRYKQEVQSANDMLTRMTNTQQNISQQAANMRLLPPSAVNDLNSMTSRIQALRNQIESVQKARIQVVGVERANAEVEGLRQQLNNALQTQEDLNAALNSMDVTAANAAYTRLNSIVDSTERNIRDNATEQQNFNNELRNGSTTADGLQNKIMGIAAAYLSIRGVGQVLNLSDTMAQTEARLNLIVDDGGSIDELQEKIYHSAQSARADFQSTADVISKLGLLAGDAFSSNDELLYFTEQMNKNFKIGGASIQEQTSAMYQLTQAMASGRLQGDEYRSILENAPLLATAIEDYMTNTGVEGTMKEWASEGLLTADVIKGALFSVADETNARFEDIPLTFSDAATNIRNTALMAFQPLLDRLNEFANSPAFQVFVDNVINVISVIANVAMEVFSWIIGISQFISDNWSIIEPIIWGVVAAFIAWKAITTIMTVVQWLLNAALLANPITWIVLAIAAIVAAIVVWANSVGGFRALWLIVVNAILTAWDWVKIGFFTGVYWVIDLWDKMKLGMMTAGTAIANFMGDMKANVLMILQNMVNGAINIINGFIDVLNKIPGVNIGLIEQVTFGTTAQLENEAEKQAREGALDDYRAEIDAGIQGRADALDGMKNDARDATAERLAGIAEAQAAASQTEDTAVESAPEASFNVPSFDEMGGIGSDVSDIASNTGKTASFSEEDLKYLRDIAERETINRFTTAEVHVEFGDVNNNVNSEMDLDGIVDYIGEHVEERLLIVAEGFYV